MKKMIYTSLFATMILTNVSLSQNIPMIYAQEESITNVENSEETEIESTDNSQVLIEEVAQTPNLLGVEQSEEQIINQEITETEDTTTLKEAVVDETLDVVDDKSKNIVEINNLVINEEPQNINQITEEKSGEIPDLTATATTDNSAMEITETAEAIGLVDDRASRETQELFIYLKEKMASKDVLFGQQHATDEGATLLEDSSRVGSTDSEVKNAVGDYPAVFGWDTLSIDGYERPGVEGDIEASIRNTVTSMKTAHDLGSIIVLSMHPHNFVTGGTFNDISGDVVNNILPGGEYNDKFNNWLDNIANVADQLKDDEGNSIPIIFRPFHEQNGSWFWWGASTTNTEQYTALYRYTVEYLRDNKEVNNILYAYSPNSSIQGDKESYLKTYPGDNYVDILGIDTYDNKQNAGSETFLNGMIKDLDMIVSLAQEKNKIAALTEFGYSPQGINETGNTLDWYTKIFDTIQSNEQASKIAYMLTWANFGLPDNMFVPYRDVNGDLGGDHELLPDFENFYNNDKTVFRNEVGKIYQTNQDIELIPNTNSRYVIRPSERQIITTDKGNITIKGLESDNKVSYQFDGEQEIFLDANEQLFSGELNLPENVDLVTTNLTIRYYNVKDELVSSNPIKVYIKLAENEKPENPLIVDQFDNYLGDTELLNQNYANNGDPVSIELVKNGSEDGYGMAVHYTLADNGYSGRQLSFNKDWSGTNAVSFDLTTNESLPHDLTVQIRIGDVSFESFVKLDSVKNGKIVIPFSDFKPAHWESNQNAIVDLDRINNVSQFALYFGGPKGEGTIYIDSIEAVLDETLPPVPARIEIDDSYQPINFEFDEVDETWIKNSEMIENGVLTLSTTLEEGSKKEISYQSGIDLSNHNWYVAKIKTSSTANAKLYVKVGDAWQWFEAETMEVGTDYSLLSFDLSSIEDKANIKEVGIELTGLSETKQPLDVTVDYVRFVESLDEIDETVSNNPDQDTEDSEKDTENTDKNSEQEESEDTENQTSEKIETTVVESEIIKDEVKMAILPATGETNSKNHLLASIIAIIGGLFIIGRRKEIEE